MSSGADRRPGHFSGQQKVAVWTLRGIGVRFMRKAQIVGVELFSEMNKLTAVTRILKQYDVLSIQTDRPHVSVFVKEVLHHEYHREVSMVSSIVQ